MATKTADDIASLREALKTATPGTTIELEPGDYGKLGINAKYGDAWGRFAGEVTIRSADPNKPATFDGIFLRGVENLTIDGIVVDYTLPAGTTGDAINYSTAVLVQEVAEVTIRNSVFDGDVLDAPGALLGGLPAAQGLVVRESDAVVIADNEFQGFRGAANFQNSSDLVVSGNDVHTMRSEGFNLVTVQDVTIEDNYIHDFVTKPGVGDHRDMIQFWTAGARAPSTDIVIRDNVLDSGTGAWTQSIFMNNEAVGGGAGREMYYRNVVVENNVIYNAHYHGITVGHADGVTIAGNTVLHNRHVDMGNVSLPSINVTSDALNVRVTKNVSHNVPKPGADSAGWQIGDNLLVQNRAADKPNYYGDLFVDVMGGDTDLAGLKGLAGSVVERGGYGSTLPSAGEIMAGPGQGGQAPKPTPEPAPKPTPEPAPKPTPEPEPTPDPGSQDITFSLAIAYDTGVLVDDDLTDGEVLALDKLDDGPVTLVATPSEGVGSVRLDLVGVHESVENVTPYALFGDIDGDFFPGTRLDVGDYEMAVTAYSGANGSGSVLGSETISFSVADQPGSAPDASGVVHRWNAGPSTVEAADGGPDWVADAGAIAGSANLYGGAIASAGTLAATVPGTTPKGIFAHEYYGSSKSAGMGLEFGDGKLEDGSYAVRLYMGNGYAGTDDAGERVFDVSVEGEIFLDDLDLSGRLGHQAGGMFEWRGTVDDGTIDIDFAHVVENPLINAVEIIALEGDTVA